MRILLTILVSVSMLACTKPDTVDNHGTTVDYLEVARLFRDSIKTYPLVIDVKNGAKRLVFIGTNHTNQVTHQADTIEKVFLRFMPEMAFNEGGEIDTARHFRSRDEAILQAAETGELKFLCDQIGISMVNGDLDDSTEWNELFKTHPRSEVLLYMCNERFIDLYARGWIDTTGGLEGSYRREFIDYYSKRGIKFNLEEERFSFIESSYRNIFDSDIDIYNMPGEKFYFLSDGGKLCALGRHSKEIRDRMLLANIRNAFRTYDRVLVVFGSAHAVAVNPALKELMAGIN